MLPIQIDSREFELLYYNITSNRKMPISIAMTGVHSQSGTSCLSYALARRMAASGHETLLIDFNLRNPDLSNQFSSKQTKWNPSDFSDAAHIETLGTTGLSIMAAPNDNAALWPFREKKLLSSMLEKLKNQYDCIILDIPSILANGEEHNIPSELVCAVSDITLISLMAGKASENDIIRAQSVLKKSGAKIHGIMMNDQFTPSLKDEICREIDRVNKFFPKLCKKIKEKVQNSVFLSQEI